MALRALQAGVFCGAVTRLLPGLSDLTGVAQVLTTKPPLPARRAPVGGYGRQQPALDWTSGRPDERPRVVSSWVPGTMEWRRLGMDDAMKGRRRGLQALAKDGDLYGQPMGPLPVDVEVRLTRAAQLLAELDQICMAYLMNKNTTTDVTVMPERCAYLVRSTVEPPPAIVSAVFGDLLNNYRSILDYIARNLVVTAGLSPIDGGPGSTMFPIRNTRPRNGTVDVPPGLPTEVREAVDGLQPYATRNEGRAHPLVELSELNNRDKHRLLNVAALSEAGNVVFVPRDVTDFTLTEDMRRYRLKIMPGKDQIVAVHPDDLLQDAEARGMWSATVVLEEADGAWSGQLVGIGRRIGVHIVEEVIPRLAPYMSRADRRGTHAGDARPAL